MEMEQKEIAERLEAATTLLERTLNWLEERVSAASALSGEVEMISATVEQSRREVELAEKARLLSPRLKVIYSSGFPADALVERNRTRADDPMLRKPYQRTEFAAMVRRTLAGTMT